VVASKKTKAQSVKGKKQSTTGKKPVAKTQKTVKIERREKKDRRKTPDRRQETKAVEVERRVIQRRVKVNRRRQIDPTTCERDYTLEEIEFMGAMDSYKRQNGRMFPTCSEVLEVLKSLGYEKRSEPEGIAPPIAALPEATISSPANVG